jgi:hypothetical protein
MKLKDLKEQLNGLGPGYDDHEVLLEGPNDAVKAVSPSLKFTYFEHFQYGLQITKDKQHTPCFIIEGG